MADSLAQMGVRFNFLAAAIGSDIDQHMVDVVNNVLYELVQRTPVDTGQARSNWQVNLGSPSTRVIGAYSPIPSRWKPRPGVNPGGSRDETSNMRAAQTLAARILRNRQTDQPMFIVNNLPYAERLLNGWSPQSPSGLILMGVDAGFRTAQANLKFTVVKKVMG